MDLILKNARVDDRERCDIGITAGRIAAIAPRLEAEGETIDLDGRLVSAGFIETHLHLDKSCILDRCATARGDLAEAIGEAAKAKAAFTAEDVHARASRTLEKSILQGTTHMRTHLEVDPGVGLRGLEGVLPLISEYAWAIDLEICVFPQEGLLNNPGTDQLMVEALKRGCRAVGAAPYTDSDPRGQIDRVFELAREFDVDIDMHLDFGPTCDDMDVWHVCQRTEEHKYGGRVTVGHVTKAASLPLPEFERMARRLAEAGVALTVLPATELYLMGRNHTHDHNQPRAVVPVHKLLYHGVNCSLSSNNVLNPFTPYRGLLADSDGESLCQCLSGREQERSAGMLRDDHAAAGPTDAASGLRGRGRQVRGLWWCSTPSSPKWRWRSWRRCCTPSNAAA